MTAAKLCAADMASIATRDGEVIPGESELRA